MTYQYYIPKYVRGLTILAVVVFLWGNIIGWIELNLLQLFLVDFVALLYFISEIYHESMDRRQGAVVTKVINRFGFFVFALSSFAGLLRLFGV